MNVHVLNIQILPVNYSVVMYLHSMKNLLVNIFNIGIIVLLICLLTIIIIIIYLESEALLTKLYSFIDTDEELNPLLASFFSKIIGTLLIRRSDQVNVI